MIKNIFKLAGAKTYIAVVLVIVSMAYIKGHRDSTAKGKKLAKELTIKLELELEALKKANKVILEKEKEKKAELVDFIKHSDVVQSDLEAQIEGLRKRQRGDNAIPTVGNTQTVVLVNNCSLDSPANAGYYKNL